MWLPAGRKSRNRSWLPRHAKNSDYFKVSGSETCRVQSLEDSVCLMQNRRLKKACECPQDSGTYGPSLRGKFSLQRHTPAAHRHIQAPTTHKHTHALTHALRHSQTPSPLLKGADSPLFSSSSSPAFWNRTWGYLEEVLGPLVSKLDPHLSLFESPLSSGWETGTLLLD